MRKNGLQGLADKVIHTVDLARLAQALQPLRA